MDVAELEQTLRAVEPAVRLVPRRVLRRVIKHDRQPPGFGLQVPHRKSHVIARDRLLQVADKDEVGARSEDELPPTLFLIARPDVGKLAAMPRDQVLVKYWRLLFHCRVHVALAERFAGDKDSEAEIRRRVHQLGQTEFDEVHRVLRQEKYLLPPGDKRTVYEEFAAVYLELRYFSPTLLPHFFPTIDDLERVDALLAEDVDAAGLFARTRLPGAPDPVPVETNTTLESARESEADDQPSSAGPGSEDRVRRLLARADRLAEAGNVARAAILRERAAQASPSGMSIDTHAQALSDLGRLIERLRSALELAPREVEQWSHALPALLEPAARGTWPVESRLLYDLQKACVDHERGVYAVDLVEWALSLGKRPVKRPLPSLREVHIVKHLRKAAGRLIRAHLADSDRHQLAALLRTALHHSERRLRERFRPQILQALDRVGMKPQNFPERVALNKLTEELLDRITERGFLNIGDLRDAVSRNNLKLPDLSGPGEFWHGDWLLRSDRELSYALDGVYRRGEVYMRWLQRLSALAFGTAVGRFLTLFLILPFGGAFVILKGLEEIVHLAAKLTGGHGVEFVNPFSLGGLGLFLFSVLHVPVFRQGVAHVLWWLWRAIRGVFYDAPAAFLRLPLVHNIIYSRPMAFFQRYLLAPILLAAAAALVLWLGGTKTSVTLTGSGSVFVIAVLLISSRLGRDLQENSEDWALRSVKWLGADFLPRVFHLIMDFFKWLVEVVERVLYTVDEWLRFKSGQSRLALVVKAILGVFWFFLTYIIRIYVNLLIEPTLNPIKHFPVVTVSHKIMAPLILVIYGFLKDLLSPLGSWIAIPFTVVTIFFLPGIFGFMVWELKENWRLYRANRPRDLKPVIIGHHGERMIGLMRPGFHSGTLPKLYTRLRRAERGGHRTGDSRAVHKQLEALHHVEERVRHFVERDLVKLLRDSKCWGAPRVSAGEIGMASNRIAVELCCPDLSEEALWIAFEEHSGWLVAGVAEAGWLPALAAQQTQILRTALAGLYKMAGVHLVREQIDACLEPAAANYAITGEGLVVWPGTDFHREGVYDLNGKEELSPRSPDRSAEGLPVLDARRLKYSEVPVTWQSWVETWEQDQNGKGQLSDVADGVRLLPRVR